MSEKNAQEAIDNVFRNANIVKPKEPSAEPSSLGPCPHGQLRRACYTCELEEQITDLRAELEAQRKISACWSLKGVQLMDQVKALEAERKEIAEATRRVNLAAYDLYSDILPAVKALEAILAAREKGEK